MHSNDAVSSRVDDHSMTFLPRLTKFSTDTFLPAIVFRNASRMTIEHRVENSDAILVTREEEEMLWSKDRGAIILPP